MRKGGARERADGLFLQKNKPEQSGLCSDVVGYYEKDAAVLRPRKRLVVSQSRRERACKRIGDANATFCGKGGARERADGLFLQKISRSKADFAPTWRRRGEFWRGFIFVFPLIYKVYKTLVLQAF